MLACVAQSLSCGGDGQILLDRQRAILVTFRATSVRLALPFRLRRPAGCNVDVHALLWGLQRTVSLSQGAAKAP